MNEDISQGRFVIPDRCFEALRRVIYDDFALMHNSDATAQAFGFFHVMGRQEYRGAELRPQMPDMFPDRAARDRIKTNCRLIQE